MKFYVRSSMARKVESGLSYTKSLSRKCWICFVDTSLEKKLDTHIAKFFNKNESAKRMEKRLLTSSSFMEPMAPMATFVGRQTDAAMVDKNFLSSCAKETSKYYTDV